MASKTTNYGLTKPLPEEFYDINVHNNNMDIIDKMMNHGIPFAEATSSDGLNYNVTISGFIEKEGKKITFSTNKSSTGVVYLSVNGHSLPLCRRNSDGTFSNSSAGRSANLTEGCIYTATLGMAGYFDGESGYFETAWILDHEEKPCANDLDGIVSIENGGTGANNAVTALANLGAAPAYTYGTTELIAGTSELETGKLYFVYE